MRIFGLKKTNYQGNRDNKTGSFTGLDWYLMYKVVQIWPGLIFFFVTIIDKHLLAHVSLQHTPLTRAGGRVEVVASLSQGCTAAAQCGLFTHKSVPVIFEPPCIKLTSLAMVVIKAAGRAVAMSVRAWRAVRQESAAGVSGSPYVILTINKVPTSAISYFYPSTSKLHATVQLCDGSLRLFSDSVMLKSMTYKGCDIPSHFRNSTNV